MTITFRRSKKIGPFRFTFSKGGVSTSIGNKLFRISKSRRGTHVSGGAGGIRFHERIDEPKLHDAGTAVRDLIPVVNKPPLAKNRRRVAYLWCGIAIAAILLLGIPAIRTERLAFPLIGILICAAVGVQLWNNRAIAEERDQR